MTPPPGFDHLLELQMESRKTVYSLLLTYYKGILKDVNEQLDEEVHRARSGRVLSAGCFTLRYADVVINLEALGTPHFRDFYGGLIVWA